jgi:hypothetical protein
MKGFLATTGIVTITAALIGPNGPLGGFWAPNPHAPKPSGAVLGGYIAERMIENLAFGVGVAILLLGRRWFTERIPDQRRARTAWLAAAWLLASWMPHSSLHMHIGMQPNALLVVEWLFHAGTIAATAALLWALLPMQQRAHSSSTTGSA